jgi:hypothetical protein
MASPLEGQPGETAEQRKARFAAADRKQAEVDAEKRAYLAAKIKREEPRPMEPQPMGRVINPFTDPNYALRQLNEYFGSLRKDYGEGAIRGAGFTPRDLSLLQASLRKLQMDPRATPEQHQQAYQQARDALAQRVTTPLAAARPTPSAPSVGAPPEVEVRGVRPPDVVNAPMPEVEVRGVRPEMPVTPPMPVPMVGNGDFRPTAAQIADHNAGRVKGQWNSVTGVFENPFVPPPTDTREVIGYRSPVPGTNSGDTRIFADQPPPMPVPSASDYIANMVTPPRPPAPSMAQPEVIVPPTMLPMPMQPVGSPALLGDAPRPIDPSMVPSTAPGILPGITQQQPAAPTMNTQPGADFDRNVARQIFDAEFRTLREKYGDQGLRAAGFTPRTLSALQAPLTNVQKDNTISYDQSSAALENALQQLRGYNFGGAQPAAAPAAPAAPIPAGAQQLPMPGYYRGGPVMRYR